MGNIITQLNVQNVQKIKAVSITPDGAAVVIGGQNTAGKSSILDAIEGALGGKRHFNPRPIREGETEASTELVLGDLTIVREFVRNPQTGNVSDRLTVTNSEGVKQKSPQAMLDALMGDIAFDPLAFARMKPAEQTEALLAAAGISAEKIAEIDAARAEAYERRTIKNREVKRLAAVVASLPDGDPEPVVDLAKAYADAKQAEDDMAGVDAAVTIAQKSLDDAVDAVMQGSAEIERLETALSEARSSSQEALEVRAGYEEHLEASTKTQYDVHRTSDAVIIAAREAIDGAAEHNELQAKRLEAQERLLEWKRADEAATAESDKITACDEGKRDLIAAAKMPTPDLSVQDGLLTYFGLPFQQASDAERLRVSIAIGLAMNAEAPVLLIRDGSLLDTDNLAMVSQMAEDAGAQVWIERVGEGEEMSVIIEDGMVKD